MSHQTVAAIATDIELRPRLIAGAAQLKKPKPYETWVDERRWDLATTPEWVDAYQAALDGPPGFAPGADPTVITDQMISNAILAME